jgi:hypothetical protein
VVSTVTLDDGTLRGVETTGLTVPEGYKPPTPEGEKPSPINWPVVIIAVLAALVLVPVVIFVVVRWIRMYTYREG